MCFEQYVTAAAIRMQGAQKKTEDWMRKWLVSLNPEKPTYTIFSLAAKGQSANLQVVGHTLPQDGTPAYLGVTFDAIITWKSQSEKCTA